eukprot:1671336-Rhodomonas_salina.3
MKKIQPLLDPFEVKEGGFCARRKKTRLCHCENGPRALQLWENWICGDASSAASLVMQQLSVLQRSAFFKFYPQIGVLQVRRIAHPCRYLDLQVVKTFTASIPPVWSISLHANIPYTYNKVRSFARSSLNNQDGEHVVCEYVENVVWHTLQQSRPSALSRKHSQTHSSNSSIDTSQKHEHPLANSHMTSSLVIGIVGNTSKTTRYHENWYTIQGGVVDRRNIESLLMVCQRS